MRRPLFAALIFLALCAGTLAALVEPPPGAELVSCQQVQHSDGSCTTICIFYQNGAPTGYLQYEWCT